MTFEMQQKKLENEMGDLSARIKEKQAMINELKKKAEQQLSECRIAINERNGVRRKRNWLISFGIFAIIIACGMLIYFSHKYGLGIKEYIMRGAGAQDLTWYAIIALAVLAIVLWVITSFVSKDVKRLSDSEEFRTYDKAVRQSDSLESEVESLKKEVESKQKEIYTVKKFISIEKNYVLVYAGAFFKGKEDLSVYRTVYIDGINYGSARPWCIAGLNSGFHSVCVEYAESVGENVYSGRTDSRTIRVDDGSKIYACVKKDTTDIYTSPTKDISQLQAFLSDISSEERDRLISLINQL